MDDQGFKSVAAAILSIAWLFAGYFLLPLIVRSTLGFLGTIAGAVNDKSRGGFDRLKNFRKSRASQRYKNAKEGRGGFPGANIAGAVYRRASLGGNPLTTRGRANYRAASKQLTRNARDEALKNDNGFAAGNDEANQLAVKDGMTPTKFLDQYSQRLVNKGVLRPEANKQAQDAMAELQKGYGAQIGSGTMQVAAFTALNASNKGYDQDTLEKKQEAMYGDAGRLVNKGLLSVSDAAGITKSNSARLEASGVGYGSAISAISEAATNAGNTRHTGPLVSQATTDKLAAEVIREAVPGALAQARPESLELLAPKMLATTTHIAETGSAKEIQKHMASVAGVLDELGRTSPRKAGILGDQLMGMEVIDKQLGRYTTTLDRTTGKSTTTHTGINNTVTVRELMERARSINPNPADGYAPFQDRRREYGNRQEADAAGAGRDEPEHK